MLAGWVAWGAGCVDSVDCDALSTQSQDASLQFGEGETAFVPVEEGHSFTPELGPQGGEHIWVALGTSGLWPGRPGPVGENEAPTVEVSVSGAESGAMFAPSQQVLDGNVEGAELAGLQVRVFRRYVKSLDMFDPGPSTLTATVTDVCGTQVRDSLEIDIP